MRNIQGVEIIESTTKIQRGKIYDYCNQETFVEDSGNGDQKIYYWIQKKNKIM